MPAEIVDIQRLRERRSEYQELRAAMEAGRDGASNPNERRYQICDRLRAKEYPFGLRTEIARQMANIGPEKVADLLREIAREMDGK